MINIYGHTGVPSGCKLANDNSGMVYFPPENNTPPITAKAIVINNTPNTGYNLPITLSIGKSVATK